ncbi:MAG: DUF4359 domain-containing protein [Halothece sp.]
MRLKHQKIKIGILGIVGMGLILIFTNPNSDRYRNHLSQEISTNLQEDFCAEAPSAFGHLLQRQCDSLVENQESQLKNIIDYSTQRNNYLLFSIYETEVAVINGLPHYQAKSIGLLNHFWIYQQGINSESH